MKKIKHSNCIAFYFFFQTEISFGKDIADGSWYFVVFTVDTDSNTVQFYLDGTAVGSPR